MPYVNQRWLGGMLTNFSTVHKRLQRLKELEAMEQAGWLRACHEEGKLILTARRTSSNAPSAESATCAGARAVWIVDTKKEHIAVGEARKLGIPVIAILDTNCDPDEVDYKIPGNDDAIRSAALLTRVIADAVAEGLMARAAAAANAGRDEKPEAGRVASDEPLAEWERDLLQPAGTQQSDSSIETASELPHGDVTGEDAGELAEAQDETAS